MRVLNFNIRQGGGTRVAALAAHVARLAPDIAVITEFRDNARGAALCAGLAQAGLVHTVRAQAEPNRNSVLIAARRRVTDFPLPLGDEDRHRMIAARIDDVLVVGAYFALGKAKEPAFRLLLSGLLQREGSVLLAGDLNTGLARIDYDDRYLKRLYAEDDFRRLPEHGWTDAWRGMHGPTRFEPTWLSPNRGTGYRLDHMFMAGELVGRLCDCRYDHATRPGLSDHSAMIAEFA